MVAKGMIFREVRVYEKSKHVRSMLRIFSNFATSKTRIMWNLNGISRII
jgi:hypothetical protein